MKVTTAGRVTIPVAIRRALDIQPGSEVDIVLDDDGIRLVPVTKTPACAQRIVERLRGSGTVRMTTDEIMALTRS